MKAFATFLEAGSVAILLGLLLFADVVCLSAATNYIGFSLKEIEVVLRDPETQWVIFVCFGIYFTAFFLLKYKTIFGFCQANNPNLWLACILLVSTVLYAMDYPSIQALTLLGTAVLGQGTTLWVGFEDENQQSEVRNSFRAWVMFLLVTLLALASVWNTGSNDNFEYHSQTRWCGPWDNPNIFGLLTGTGVVLALGLGSVVWHWGHGKFIIVILCLVAAGLMARGLLHSYSRGAWVGTFFGLGYLVVHGFRIQSPRFSLWIRKNIFGLTIIFLSTGVLTIWQLGQTNHGIAANRAFSVANTNDFSWRNRLAAWEGALQIAAEHPWFGTGWNQSEPLYEHYYLSSKLNDSAAIEMNDYLMLGATLGVPALFCFVMYLWLSITGKSEIGNWESEIPEVDWLQITCHAGAIVLLVSFWFDGGLFKLPTAATFWILLGLGSVALHRRAAKAAQ